MCSPKKSPHSTQRMGAGLRVRGFLLSYLDRFIILRSISMPDLADYMTVQEAAEKLGFHVDHVRRMRRQGVLDAFKVGATWLISKESVERYLEDTAGTEKHDPFRRKKSQDNTEATE